MKAVKTLLAALAFSAVASAAVQTFNTTAGTTIGGLPISASATFTPGTNSLLITLTNLQANPTSVIQLISDLDFALSNGATTGTISSSSGQLVTVNANGTFATGATQSTGWGLVSNFNGGIQLNALGFVGPEGLIIGPPGGATYTNANGSIAGNDAHNPFINQTATFNLSIAGVTSSTVISKVVFSFGTTSGSDVTGCLVGGPSCNSTVVPEPISSALVGTGLISLFFLRRRASKKA